MANKHDDPPRIDVIRMEPDERVVRRMQELLAEAESGNLRAFAGVADYAGGDVREILAGEFKNRFEHAGFLINCAVMRLR